MTAEKTAEALRLIFGERAEKEFFDGMIQVNPVACRTEVPSGGCAYDLRTAVAALTAEDWPDRVLTEDEITTEISLRERLFLLRKDMERKSIEKAKHGRKGSL